MTETPLPGIHREDFPTGARFILPRRRLGSFRFIGWFLCGLGSLFMVFAGSMIVSTLGDFLRTKDWFALPFAFAVFTPFLIGMFGTVFGLLVLFGHGEVSVEAGQLTSTDRLGFLRFRRKVATALIDRFRIVTAATDGGVKKSAAPGAAREGLSAVIAKLREGKQFLAVIGYPPEILKPLAESLAELCRVPTEEGEPDAGPLVEEEERMQHGMLRVNRYDQPANSLATLEDHADGGVTINTAPAGVWRGSHGLFSFALIWLAIVIFILAVFGFIMTQGNVRKNLADGGWIIGSVASLFIVIGIGMLAGAINMGRRRAVFAVVGPRLMVMQTGMFGGKRREWDREDIDTIALGPSGMTVNNHPVYELTVATRDGKRTGFLAGRDVEELHWIATRLRTALGSGEAV